MTRPFLTILALCFCYLATAQKKHQTFTSDKVDTLHVFQPIGYIGVPEKGRIIPNDSLTNEFLSKLQTALPKTAPFKINYLTNNSTLSDSSQKLLIDFMYKFDKLDDKVFANNIIGNKIRIIVNKQSGRFFGIICYSGFEQSNLGAKRAASMALGIGTALLTGGMFWATSIPAQPYLNTYLAIIDKEDECVLFYNFKTVNKSPMQDNTINDVLVKNFKKY